MIAARLLLIQHVLKNWEIWEEVDRKNIYSNLDKLSKYNHLVMYDLSSEKLMTFRITQKDIKLQCRNRAIPWVQNKMIKLHYLNGVAFKLALATQMKSQWKGDLIK